MNKKLQEFRLKVKEDVFSSLTEEEISQLLMEKDYPLYFKDGDYYTTHLFSFLLEKGYLDHYMENEMRWITKRGKHYPPHMNAIYSSSRIALFYYLGRKEITNLVPEQVLEITGEKGPYPHLDFAYQDNNSIYFIECKTSEVCTRKAFMLHKRHLYSVQRFTYLTYPLIKNHNFSDFSYEWLGTRETEDGIRGKLSVVDFKQVVTHLLGICSKIEKDDDKKNQYILHYDYFSPSSYSSHPDQKEIEEEMEAFLNSSFYQSILYVKSGQLKIDSPSYIQIKEVKDPILAWIFPKKD